MNNFLSEQEIIEDLWGYLNDFDKEWLRENHNNLYAEHHGFGRHIRNKYKLWHVDNPHAKSGVLIINGIDHSPNHPDAISMRVMEALANKAIKTYE